MYNDNSIHLRAGDVFEGGHKPGIIRIRADKHGIACVSLFMEPEHLEQLRDECQRQIWELEKQSAEAARLPSNAPAAELAAQVGALEPTAAPPLDGQPAHDHGEQVIALDEPDIPF